MIVEGSRPEWLICRLFGDLRDLTKRNLSGWVCVVSATLLNGRKDGTMAQKGKGFVLKRGRWYAQNTNGFSFMKPYGHLSTAEIYPDKESALGEAYLEVEKVFEVTIIEGKEVPNNDV